MFSFIEFLMIKANQIVAEKIFNFNKKNCILRIHQKNTNLKTKSNNIDTKLKKYLDIINSKSAIYISKFENDNETFKHEGLNIDFYTHFTSPIRRYSDIIVHRILNQMIIGKHIENNYEEICIQMNCINKNIRKSDREIEKINFISQNIQNEIIEAYITEIKPISNKIQIYISESNMSFYINICSDKLRELIKCNYGDNYFEIHYRNSEEKNRFYLLQKIKILVSTRIEANNIEKKCIMSILDKDNAKIIDFLL